MTLLHLDNATLLPATPLPPAGANSTQTPDVPPTEALGEEVATLTVRDQGAQVCADVAVAGGGPQNLACVARLLLGPADDHLPRGDTTVLQVPATNGTSVPDLPGIAPGELGSTPEVTVSADVSYSYNPSRVFQAASLLNGSATVNLPVAPTPGDASWLLEHGNETGLTVSAGAYADGAELHSASATVPYPGQALGSALPPCPPGASTPTPCYADDDGDGVPNEGDFTYESCDDAEGDFYICRTTAHGLLGLGVRIYYQDPFGGSTLIGL